MKLNLSENIRSCRKQRELTQEQLAEALGVTVGAVSKWESGATTPELEMLVRIAGFFDLSVDALLGWRLESGGLSDLVGQMKACIAERRFEEATVLGEKAMQKYPNNFDAAYQSALAWFALGTFAGGNVDREAFRRAKVLLRRALSLADQNADPEISPWLIRNQIAECCIYLGEAEEALKLYRENNVNGVNNARIAQALSDILKRHDEALPYARRAFRQAVEDLSNTMIAMGSAYFGKKQLGMGLECLGWLVGALESLRPDGGFCETDLLAITLVQAQGEVYYEQGDLVRAKEYMLRARRLARAYDATPREQIVPCRFFRDDGFNGERFHYIYFGQSGAVESLEKRLHWNSPEEEPGYYRLWDEVTREIEGEGTK